MIAQPAVAILSGDHVVGRALEALLQDTRYESRFVNNCSSGELENMLVGVGVVILTGDYEEQGEGFMSSLVSMSTGLGIPVLKLVPGIGGKNEDLVRMVSWPCPIENLKREIEAALATGSGTKAMD